MPLAIIIQTDADFTPAGKRTVRVVELTAMGRPVRRIRWYVSGRIYNTLPVNSETTALSQEWVAAA
jgi:hypothetical protein